MFIFKLLLMIRKEHRQMLSFVVTNLVALLTTIYWTLYSVKIFLQKFFPYTGLLNRRTGQPVPRVRISSSPQKPTRKAAIKQKTLQDQRLAGFYFSGLRLLSSLETGITRDPETERLPPPDDMAPPGGRKVWNGSCQTQACNTKFRASRC